MIEVSNWRDFRRHWPTLNANRFDAGGRGERGRGPGRTPLRPQQSAIASLPFAFEASSTVNVGGAKSSRAPKPRKLGARPKESFREKRAGNARPSEWVRAKRRSPVGRSIVTHRNRSVPNIPCSRVREPSRSTGAQQLPRIQPALLSLLGLKGTGGFAGPTTRASQCRVGPRA